MLRRQRRVLERGGPVPGSAEDAEALDNDASPSEILETVHDVANRIAASAEGISDRLSGLQPPERLESDARDFADAYAVVAESWGAIAESEDGNEINREIEESDKAIARGTAAAKRLGLDRFCTE